MTMEISGLDTPEEHCNTSLVLCIRQFKVFLHPSDPGVSCHDIAKCRLCSRWYKIYLYLFDPR